MRNGPWTNLDALPSLDLDMSETFTLIHHIWQQPKNILVTAIEYGQSISEAGYQTFCGDEDKNKYCHFYSDFWLKTCQLLLHLVDFWSC